VSGNLGPLVHFAETPGMKLIVCKTRRRAPRSCHSRCDAHADPLERPCSHHQTPWHSASLAHTSALAGSLAKGFAECTFAATDLLQQPGAIGDHCRIVQRELLDAFTGIGNPADSRLLEGSCARSHAFD